MDRFEEQLRQALRRTEPPPGFAERVLERAAAEAEGRSWWRRFAEVLRMPGRRWAVAALAGVVILAGVGYEREMRRRQGERAKQQVLEALEITAEQFQIARRHVEKLNTVWEVTGGKER